MPDYQISPARYAKSMMAVRCNSSGGYKSRAMRLISDGLNCRWSGREGAYIPSASKVKKFEQLYAAGYDASVITGELEAPKPDEDSSAAPERSQKGRMYGYARVSSTDQDLAIQEEKLRSAGCDLIRAEKKSGTTTAGRSELQSLLDFIRAGDTLVVAKIDRLARSLVDLAQIVKLLGDKGAHLKATDQPIDTSTAAGRAFLQMLGVFAEFETAIRRERQLDGIAKAKKEGVYKGRPATLDAEKVAKLKAEGMGASQIAKQLGIGRASVYRLLRQDQSKTPGAAG